MPLVGGTIARPVDLTPHPQPNGIGSGAAQLGLGPGGRDRGMAGGGGPGVRMALPATFRRGGRVKRTGWAKVHKGEKVIPAGARSLGAGKKKAAKKTPKTPRAKAKVKKTMDEWKSGTLHSGSKKGPKVTNQKQAVAIALSQARKKA